MNAVKKCSLSGIAFTMDLEAYNELNNYLEGLKQSYRESSDGAEIVADIEARIAELILSTQATDRVVELPLIRNIIAQMGSANEIHDEEPAATHSASVRNPRRLYRDPENAKLGGVCAGIGKYFDLDPVWIRLAIFLPLFFNIFGWIPFFRWLSPLMGNLFGIFIICYLVMWFAVPVARTARQKLEMNGERITADSIRDTTLAAGDPDGAAKTAVADTVSVLAKIVMLLLKLFAGLIVFSLVLIACGLLIGAIALTIGGYEIINENIPLSVPFLGIGIGLIPVVMLIYILVCLLASRKANGKVLLGGGFLWIILIIACSTIAIRYHYQHGEAPIQSTIEQIGQRQLETLKKRIRINRQELTVEQLLEQLESGEITRQVEINLNPDLDADKSVDINISVKKRSRNDAKAAAAPAETAAEAPKAAAESAAEAAGGQASAEAAAEPSKGR